MSVMSVTIHVSLGETASFIYTSRYQNREGDHVSRVPHT